VRRGSPGKKGDPGFHQILMKKDGPKMLRQEEDAEGEKGEHLSTFLTCLTEEKKGEEKEEGN